MLVISSQNNFKAKIPKIENKYNTTDDYNKFTQSMDS